MKKTVWMIFCVMVLILPLSANTPNEAMDDLLNLFRSYQISSIPKKIKAGEFEEKVIDKITRNSQSQYILTIYKKNGKSGAYELSGTLDAKTKKKVLNIFHSVGFKRLTDTQIKQNDVVKGKIDQIFDFDALILGALRDQWDNMTKGQQNSFYTTFKSLVELIAYPQGSYFYGNSDVKLNKAVINGENATISSVNYNKDKDIEVTIAYVLKQYGSKWKMVDISMNDHSLINAYRSQINRIVKKKGLEGLLETLDKKYKELTK